MAMSSTHEAESITAFQKWKDEIAKSGIDIHDLAEHMENVGKQIVPNGYYSQAELNKRLEAATREAVQRGRELERLSRGQTAVDWHAVCVECLKHRRLDKFMGKDGTLKDEREFVE